MWPSSLVCTPSWKTRDKYFIESDCYQQTGEGKTGENLVEKLRKNRKQIAVEVGSGVGAVC